MEGHRVYEHIEMDPARRRVRVRGRDVELTAQEFLEYCFDERLMRGLKKVRSLICRI